MPNVAFTADISAPLERVYALSKNTARFPEFVAVVKSIKLVSEEGNIVVSDWVAQVPEFMIKVRWRQEDVWNDKEHTCLFRQLRGDYQEWHGVWTFIQHEGFTRFTCEVTYEYNIPTLGPLVRKVIHMKVEQSLAAILDGIKLEAEHAT